MACIAWTSATLPWSAFKGEQPRDWGSGDTVHNSQDTDADTGHTIHTTFWAIRNDCK
jgi:hypothetical protein